MLGQVSLLHSSCTLGLHHLPAAAASPHDAQALLSFLQVVIPAVGCRAVRILSTSVVHRRRGAMLICPETGLFSRGSVDPFRRRRAVTLAIVTIIIDQRI